MDKLVECVPNFSEGRDPSKVEAIVSAARAVRGVTVLDVETDPDHHRSVVTLVGGPGPALEAAFRAARKASELIDLTLHKGEHPRMGAVDVIPFIPVRGVSMEDCVLLARTLGRKIGEELSIPVYLYEEAATRPERRNLAHVRKGQFEALREEIGKVPERDPDFGPRRIHPTAGAVAVGARRQIINFNMNLDSCDLAMAARVAKAVRASGGGLPGVRAKEIELAGPGGPGTWGAGGAEPAGPGGPGTWGAGGAEPAGQGRVQISTVLTDHETTSIHRVVEEVRRASGCEVESTEIVGLVPRDALLRYAVEALKVKAFDPRTQVLEERLASLGEPAAPGNGTWQEGARAMVDAVGDVTPAPGGGSVSALAAALGAALGRMVAGITAQSLAKKLEKDPSLQGRLQEARGLEGEFSRFAGELLGWMAEDARAFEGVMAATKLPRDAAGRAEAIQKALRDASEVPLATARAAREVLRRLKDLSKAALPSVASDIHVAEAMAKAGVVGALENVEINLGSMKDPAYVEEARRRAAELRAAAA